MIKQVDVFSALLAIADKPCVVVGANPSVDPSVSGQSGTRHNACRTPGHPGPDWRPWGEQELRVEHDTMGAMAKFRRTPCGGRGPQRAVRELPDSRRHGNAPRFRALRPAQGRRGTGEREMGVLPRRRGDARSQRLPTRSPHGGYDDHFRWTCSRRLRTSSNMNANRRHRDAGPPARRPGRSPNDDVNAAQSSKRHVPDRDPRSRATEAVLHRRHPALRHLAGGDRGACRRMGRRGQVHGRTI